MELVSFLRFIQRRWFDLFHPEDSRHDKVSLLAKHPPSPCGPE